MMDFVSIMMHIVLHGAKEGDKVSKTDVFCIKNENLCIKSHKTRNRVSKSYKNDEFCIKIIQKRGILYHK